MRADWHKWKRCESMIFWTNHVTLTLDFQGQLELAVFQELDSSTDMERKDVRKKGCWTYYVSLNFDLAHDLVFVFSRSNFPIAISQEWKGQLTWSGWDVIGYDIGPTTIMEAWTLTSTMTWYGSFGFARSNFKIFVFQDRPIDMKQYKYESIRRWSPCVTASIRILAIRSQPWIFKVQFWK